MKRVLCLLLSLVLMYPAMVVSAVEGEDLAAQVATEESAPLDGTGEYTVSLSGIQAEGDTVTLSVDVEHALANQMGYDPAVLMGSSSLALHQDLYTLLSNEGSKVLHLDVSYAPQYDQFDWYIAAKNAHADYAQYKEYEVKGVAINAQIVEIRYNDRVPFELPPAEETVQEYTVTMPIPTAMVECKAYAIAYYGENAIDKLVPVTPQGGSLTWTMPTMQPVAILGFGMQTDMAISGSQATISGNRVGLPVDVDSSLIKEIGKQIDGRVVFWMNKEDHDELLGSRQETLHFSLSSASQAVTLQNMIDAKNADVRYKDYTDKEVQGVAFQMGLRYVSDRNYEPIGDVYDKLDSFSYNLQIPVPESMKNCAVVTVASVNEKGITMLRPILPENGMIVLPSSLRFGTFVVIGFGQATQEEKAPMTWGEFFTAIFTGGALDDVPPLLWGGLIGGVVMVAGGILLLIFVTFRRAKARKRREEKEHSEGKHVLINPTKDEAFDVNDDASVPEERRPQPVHMDMDMQAELSHEEAAQYRAKSTVHEDEFENISSHAVSPADQIGYDQLASIREDVEQKNGMNSAKRISVDDLLEEVTVDLERLDKKQ